MGCSLPVKKKLLFFLPGGVGGAERMTITIAKFFPQEKFDIKLVVLGVQNAIFDFIPERFTFDRIPIRNILHFTTLRILFCIKKKRPDLVFCSHSSYNPRVIIAAKCAGIPVIIRSSGMVGSYENKYFIPVKLTYRFADIVIAQQNDMRSEMINLLGLKPKKVIVLFNPLDEDAIKTKALQCSPYTDEGEIRFCNVASICERKAQDIAILAFAIVKKQIDRSGLYLVGKYDEKSEYYQKLQDLISENGLGESVHFVGYESNPYKWVKNCHCFVFPSRIEGLPNALIEASFLNRPSVATKCLNIISDIIKDGKNGYSVNVDDVEGFADGMLKAIYLENCNMVYSPSNGQQFISLFEKVMSSRSGQC